MSEKYIKDFDGWNLLKKDINQIDNKTFFNEREIWWCSIGVNVDTEIDGKNNFFERPVLILKKINYRSALVIPLTSNFIESIYLYKLSSIESNLSLSQIRNISSKRLLRKVIRISLKEYAEIIIRIKYILDIQNETLTISEGISEPEGTMK